MPGFTKLSNADLPAYASDDSSGLTKRELMSMVAMQGLLARGESPGRAQLVALAVAFADDLLSELGKK